MDRDCEKIERLISDRLDGEISPSDELTLQAHLNRCEECRRFEESSRWYRERLRSLPDLEVDEPTLYSSERTKGTHGFWGKRISLRIPVAAVLAMLMLTGWLLALLPSGKTTETSPSQPILVQSVEIIKAQPAQVSSVKADPDNSLEKQEDDI
jgi:anti-sigma factor RsiW